MATGVPMGTMGPTAAPANLIIEDHIKKRINRGNLRFHDPKKSTLVPRIKHSPFGDFPSDFLPAKQKSHASAEPELALTATSKYSCFTLQNSEQLSRKAQEAARKLVASTRNLKPQLLINPKQVQRRSASFPRATFAATMTVAIYQLSLSIPDLAAVFAGSKMLRYKRLTTTTTCLFSLTASVKNRNHIAS